jgi:hypothetical protein
MFSVNVRSIDGTFNNLIHPQWGSSDEQLLRRAAAEYGDLISTPAGADRLGAREISNLMATQPVENILNDRNLSAMIYAFGQFLDHDLGLTNVGTPREPLPVPVPLGDAYFDPANTGTQTIRLSRSAFDPATGTSIANPRQQLNSVTAFIDGSQIYGSDPERAAALRSFQGGKLKVSDGDLLPYNTSGLPNDNATGLPVESLFLGGDVRVNENIELTSLHTLFVREHNRLADQLAARNPGWSDEQIFQQARRLVIGELQAITYNEFLPALLGDNALRSYRGYRPNVNPGIATEFSTAAFRLGHSLLGNDVEFLDNFGNEVGEEIPLREAFFNPGLLSESGIDSILKYLASDPAQELDNRVVDEVRNFLFGPPGAGGFDLASLNIQRGRDHGLADYNTVRAAYGLRPAQNFADITSDVSVQQSLRDAYGNVNNIDLWVGGLAEDHVGGGSVGPLFRRILVDQFERLRDGDRFWYERDLSGRDLQQVRQTTLADVIRRNTTTTNLQDNVFFFYNSIAGKVFLDGNENGRASRGERGLAGIVVELQGLDGSIIASAITASDGGYSFEGLDLGVYRLRVKLPDSMRQTSYYSTSIDLTRGEKMPTIEIGVATKHRHSLAAGHWDDILGQALESLDLGNELFWPWGSRKGGR